MTRLRDEFGGEKNGADIVRRLRNNIGALHHLDGELKMKALSAYMDALRGVWGSMLTIAILGAVASFFMKENTLHSTLARK